MCFATSNTLFGLLLAMRIDSAVAAAHGVSTWHLTVGPLHAYPIFLLVLSAPVQACAAAFALSIVTTFPTSSWYLANMRIKNFVIWHTLWHVFPCLFALLGLCVLAGELPLSSAH